MRKIVELVNSNVIVIIVVVIYHFDFHIFTIRTANSSTVLNK